jgi:hypothetical protein
MTDQLHFLRSYQCQAAQFRTLGDALELLLFQSIKEWALATTSRSISSRCSKLLVEKCILELSILHLSQHSRETLISNNEKSMTPETLDSLFKYLESKSAQIKSMSEAIEAVDDEIDKEKERNRENRKGKSNLSAWLAKKRSERK